MKKMKNPSNNAVKNSISSRQTINGQNSSKKNKDKINMVLGDKVKELQIFLKRKKNKIIKY